MSERLTDVEFPEPDALGRMTINFDMKKILEESKSPAGNEAKTPGPPEPPQEPQTSQLYVYKDTPFPACVEWPEIVEDDCYLAGLWRLDLWVGISWFRNPHAAVGARPAYRAPTWSWASLDCAGVQFPGGPSNYTRSENGLSYTDDLELLDARVTLAGLNPFGQVRSGRLAILGRIVDLPFFDDENGQSQPRVDGVELRENLKMMVRDESDVLPVHCKSIAIDHRTNLIVEPVTMLNGAQAYRRVGLWMQDIRDNTLMEDNRHLPKEMIFLV
ncbi:hypothetical protein BKA64DRAFT_757439 [Cadophora sp. MPI-SDFR-AT-0126]|nr:hypothetical protein BKA64DRAFT_757439 [Leotiomycetes sp. MPI-SDFR-AT-0126]